MAWSEREKTLMTNRAAGLAHGGDSSAGSADDSPVVLLFRVGPLRLGMDVRHVREVTREIPVELPLPASTCCAGFLMLRGQTVAVFDMHALLGVPRDSSIRPGRLILLRPAVCRERIVNDELPASVNDGNEVHDASAYRLGSIGLRVDAVDRLESVEPVDADGVSNCLPDAGNRMLYSVARTPDGDLVGIVAIDRVLSGTGLEGDAEERGCGS